MSEPESNESDGVGPEGEDLGGVGPEGDADVTDGQLADAGARLRSDVGGVPTSDVVVTALRRRQRRLSIATVAASVIAVAAIGLGLALNRDRVGDPAISADEAASGGADAGGGAAVGDADVGDSAATVRLLRSLPAQPVDPTKVTLTADVAEFAQCDPLLDRLRTVGAEHVGSQGFNGTSMMYGDAMASEDAGMDKGAAPAADGVAATGAVSGGPETLGTNIQVAGVDEPDVAKAVGSTIYDLRNDRLQVVNTESGKVIGRLDLDQGDEDQGEFGQGDGARLASTSQLLVSGTSAVIFGEETVTSEPIEDDPSAARSQHRYLTVTLVDVTDPTKPTVTQRIRLDGYLVSARLVDGQVRMVTGSSLADIGFVMPTSPESIPTALEANRRSVARSTIANWVPSWQPLNAAGELEGDPKQLVPCERVHVPDTFAGVSMTSMVQFPATGAFEPVATSLLAPSTELYATADRVTISSTVWVDPAVAETLEFERWDSALHQFSFDGEAPGYRGSGIVEGNLVNQFAFGEVGDRLGLVTSPGTPWGSLRGAGASGDEGPAPKVTLHLFDQSAELVEASTLDDLGDGEQVVGVRFTPTRVFVSTTKPNAFFGTPVVRVIDVGTAGTPRVAGEIDPGFAVNYLHPIDDDTVIALGTRSDEDRGYLDVGLIDAAAADAPKLTGTWELADASAEAVSDHHAFTWWAAQNLVGFGVQRSSPDPDDPPPPPVAAVLNVEPGAAAGAVTQRGLPQPTKVNVEAPCPQIPADELGGLGVEELGDNVTLLRCDQPERVVWPGWECSKVDAETLTLDLPEGDAQQSDGRVQLCNKQWLPEVARVLVVAGNPWLLTSQSAERVDLDSLVSQQVIPIG